MKIVIVRSETEARITPNVLYGTATLISNADLVIGLPKGRHPKVLKSRLADDDRIDIRMVG